MKKTALAAVLFFTLLIGITVAQTTEKEIVDKHGEAGISCEDCHGTAEPSRRAPVGPCKECHGEYSELAELTKNVESNPHDSHQGEIRCTICHKTHEPSVVYCNECHSFNLKIN